MHSPKPVPHGFAPALVTRPVSISVAFATLRESRQASTAPPEPSEVIACSICGRLDGATARPFVPHVAVPVPVTCWTYTFAIPLRGSVHVRIAPLAPSETTPLSLPAKLWS